MKPEKYPKFNKGELQRLEVLTELYELEHGGCDDSTCSMSVAMEHGYAVHALELWAHCGAASDEFIKIFNALPGNKISQASLIEANEICETIAHIECIKCNAVIWEPENLAYKGMVRCESCGDRIPFGSEVSHEKIK